jgi:hypothetical protein
MKIFWSWQSDTPGNIGRYLVRDALNDAIEKLKQDEDVEDAPRDLHLDHDIKNVTGSPDLVRTILEKIEKSEVVVADVTIVGKAGKDKCLINSNVAIELGYSWHACTDTRVLLVFNEHYGAYADLPFDLRHKGGAVVFDLAPEADTKEIEAQRKSLASEFARKLKPFLQLPLRIKEPLSLKAVIEHRLERAHPMPGGGTDDRYELSVSVENDGEQVATDFQLDVEVPNEFVDDSGHRLLGRSINPGLARFTIDHRDEIVRKEHFYPGTRTPPLIVSHCAVRDQTKRQHPEALEKAVTATVFSGSMKPRKTVLTIAELMS